MNNEQILPKAFFTPLTGERDLLGDEGEAFGDADCSVSQGERVSMRLGALLHKNCWNPRSGKFCLMVGFHEKPALI